MKQNVSKQLILNLAKLSHPPNTPGSLYSLDTRAYGNNYIFALGERPLWSFVCVPVFAYLSEYMPEHNVHLCGHVSAESIMSHATMSLTD